jgi:hypothetical protein
MNRNQRNQRDQVAARSAVHIAHAESKTIGIAVNNDLHGERMLKRVLRAARGQGLDVGDSKRGSGTICTKIGNGQVNIISADHL